MSKGTKAIAVPASRLLQLCHVNRWHMLPWAGSKPTVAGHSWAVAVMAYHAAVKATDNHKIGLLAMYRGMLHDAEEAIFGDTTPQAKTVLMDDLAIISYVKEWPTIIETDPEWAYHFVGRIIKIADAASAVLEIEASGVYATDHTKIAQQGCRVELANLMGELGRDYPQYYEAVRAAFTEISQGRIS